MTTTADPRNVWEHAARAFELRAPDPVREQADVDSWRTPGTLAKRLNTATVETPALRLIDQALQDLLQQPDGRLVVELPPQEGKSTRVAKDFILWVLKHRPWTRVVGASYGQGLANRNGRAIRNIIRSNPDLGLQLAADNGSASEWQLAGYEGGLVSVGIGAGLTGRPADLMVIDDPIKDRKRSRLRDLPRQRVGLVDRRRLDPPRPRCAGGADPDQVARGRPGRAAARRRGRPPVAGAADPGPGRP